MISQEKANEILNVLCGTTDSMSACLDVFLGYSATEPDPVNGAVSGEPESQYYHRLKVGGKYTYKTDANGGYVLDSNKQKITSHEPVRRFTSAKDGVIWNMDELMFRTAREDFGTMYYWFLSGSETVGTPAFLWGKVYRKLEGGSKEWGLTIEKETVPVFYEKDLVASIDVDPVVPEDETTT